MSFGFSVGDFIAIIRLARGVRDRFKGAPKQFEDVSKDLEHLYVVLDQTYSTLPQHDFTPVQEQELIKITTGCREILNDLEKKLEKGDPRDRGKGTFQNYWRRLRWHQESIVDFRQRLDFYINLLSAFITQLNNETIGCLKIKIEGIQSHGQAQERRDYNERLATWFSPIDYATQQADFISRRQQGTGQWFLESAQYRQWLKYPGKVLLCTGNPGAGKTIISSVVIDSIEKMYRDDETVALAFLYLSYQPQQKQKTRDLIGCIIRQLLQSSGPVPDEVQKLYDEYNKKKKVASLEDLSIVMDAAVRPRSRVYIIVDGLDEYCTSSPSGVETFLAPLLQLQKKTSFNLFATSRPIPNITAEFQGCLHSEIRAHDDDLRAYIDARIPSLLQKRIINYPTLMTLVREKVFAAADGMFLHLELLMQMLSEKLMPGTLKKLLNNLPHGNAGLGSLYDQSIARIQSQSQDSQQLATKSLSWIIHTRTALSIGALLSALSVQPDTSELDTDFCPLVDTIVSVCAGLVAFDEKSGVLRLVHKTTEEYFRQKPNVLFSAVEAHALIAESCIAYLSFDDFASGACNGYVEYDSRLDSHPLYSYAANNFVYHAKHSGFPPGEAVVGNATQSDFEPTSPDPTQDTYRMPLADKLLKFLQGSTANLSACAQAVLSSTQHIHPFDETIPHLVVGVHLSAYFGLDNIIQALVANGQSVESQDNLGQTPLRWAVEGNHLDTVRLLLGHYQVNPNQADYWTQTVLYRATANGFVEVVKELLKDSRVDPNASTPPIPKPLIKAAQHGYTDIVRALLERYRTDKNEPPPMGSAWASDRYIVPLHRSKNLRHQWDQNAAVHAAKSGHWEIVAMILDKDNSLVDQVDKERRTVLGYAAHSGLSSVMVRFIADYGAKPDHPDADGRTPLSWAAENGHTDIVTLLLGEYGANADSEDNKGRTPCSYAAGKGRTDTVILLVKDHGANVNSMDTKGRSPCSYAAEVGYTDIVTLLIKDYGANANSIDKKGRTLYSYAAQGGNTSTWEFLRSCDLGLHSPDQDGKTPFMYAAEFCRIDMMDLLLKHSANAEDLDLDGCTPLYYAVRSWRFWDRNAAVDWLLTKARVAPDPGSLKYAARWHPQIHKLLLAQRRVGRLVQN